MLALLISLFQTVCMATIKIPSVPFTNWRSWKVIVCRLSVLLNRALLQRDMSCTMGFNEFKELWSVLNGWKQHFMSIDRDHSGTVDPQEMQQAMASMGMVLFQFG